MTGSDSSKKNPWEAYPDVWPTKAKFFTWLRGAFRKAVWSHYPGRIKFKNERCEKPPEGYTGKAKSGAYCALTGEWVGKSNLEVDHVIGEASLREWADVESFIRHLCPTADNMQLVSKEAHKIKSYAERMGITFAEAVIEKKVIAFGKESVAKQREVLTSVCKYETIASNARGRAAQYREWLYKEQEIPNALHK